MRGALAALAAIVVLVSSAHARAPGIDSPIKTIYLIAESHLDIGFTDTPAAVAQLQKGILDSAIALADRNADYIWNVETLWQLEQWMARSTPSEIAHLVDVIHRGQIALHACYLNLHSDALAEEETLRMFAFADSLRRAWNVTIEDAIQDDVPGYNWAYPTAMRQSGVHHLLCGLNTGLGGGVAIPRSEWPFYWVGPEGDSVLTWVTNDDYLEATFTYGLWSVSSAFTKLSQLLPQWVADGYPYDAILVFAATGDNGLPSIAQTQVVRDWNATYENPRLVMATPDSFFQHLQYVSGDAHPAHAGTFGGFWDAGTVDTPHSLAAVRRAHDQARAAEVFASASAALALAPYPLDTDRWVRTQTMQFDDHNGGGAPWPNQLTRGQTRQQSFAIMNMAFGADSASAVMRDTALDALAAQVVTPDSALVVFNASSWSRSGLVRIALPDWATVEIVDARTETPVPVARLAAGGEIAFVAVNVPGVGYATFTRRAPLAPAPPPARITDDPSIENEFYRVTVSATDGSVTSLFDKTAGRELVNPGAPYPFNGLIYASNLEALFETYHVAPLGAGTVTTLDTPPLHTLTVQRPGSMMPAVTLTLVDGVSSITITDTVDRTPMRHVAYSDNFDYYDVTFPFALGAFTAHIDWQGRAGVPEADNLPGAEIPYFVTTHGGEMNEGAYGLRWASSEAMVWEWDKIRSYATTFAPQSASLLARILKKEDEAKYKNTGIGPLEPELGQSPAFDVSVTFTTHPGTFDPSALHTFGWETVAPCAVRAVPPQSSGALPPVSAHLLTVDTSAVVVLTARPSERTSGFLIRLANTGAGAVTARVSSDVFDVISAERTDLVEATATPLALDGRGVSVAMAPWEVTTLRVQLAPAVTSVREGDGRALGSGLIAGAPRALRSGALVLRLARSAHVEAALYDAAGRRVADYPGRDVQQGVVQLATVGRTRPLARGVYVVRVVADGQALVRTVAILDDR